MANFQPSLDRVLVPAFGPNEVKIGGEKFILLKESEILGKIS